MNPTRLFEFKNWTRIVKTRVEYPTRIEYPIRRDQFKKNAPEINASDFNQKEKRFSNHKEKTISKREEKIIFHRKEKIVFNREKKFIFIQEKKNSTFINCIKIMQENNALNELY